MNQYNEEIIKEIREKISNDGYELTANIKGLEVCFSGKTVESVSDEMIVFALDIVNAYLDNRDKYDHEALEVVKECVGEEEAVDDSTILDQLGTPIIDVSTKEGASLMYGGVEEIGDHMPELRLNRACEVSSVALNG